jgi:hypothetical protein
VDHRAKLERARHHLDTLEAAIDKFMDNEPYDAVAKYSRAKGGYYAILRRAEPLPAWWSLVVGDAVHNLRSSLDTLVYALTKKALGREPTTEEVREVQYPIVEELRSFPGEFGRRVRYLGKDEWAEIFWTQPFWFTDPTLTDKPRLSVLAILRDLSNVDKHRHLVIAAAAATSSSIELVGPGIDPGTTLQGYTGPLEKNTVIAQWQFMFENKLLRLGDLDEAKVKARGKLALDVEFAKDGPGKGTSVLGILRQADRWFDQQVFPPLEAILNRP